MESLQASFAAEHWPLMSRDVKNDYANRGQQQEILV